MRGDAVNTKIVGSGSIFGWVLSGNNIACTGNIETLRGATGDKPSSTSMAKYCYGYMFFGCTSLTAAPALPATSMAKNCYGYMFSGCRSLTAAPALPATNLAEKCCQYMFQTCTSPTTASSGSRGET